MCPILTLDHRGMLMESDPDRGDGKGYKGKVPSTLSGDVTLGDAALRSSTNQEALDAYHKKVQTIQDAAEIGMGAEIRRRRRARANAKAFQDEVRRTQEMQDHLTREGVRQTMMGCTDLAVNSMTGNAMTADGGALPPNNPVYVYPVDPVELKNQIMNSVLFNQLCAEAQSQSQMVAYDEANSKVGIPQTEMTVESLKAVSPVPAARAVAVAHPLAAFFGKRG